MAYFRVDTQALENTMSKLSKIKKHMDSIQQDMSTITSCLAWEIKGQQQLDKKLSQLQSDFDALKASLTRAEDCLAKVKNEYIDAPIDAKKELNDLPVNVSGTSLLSAAAAIGSTVISKMLGIAHDNCQYAGDPVNVTTGSFYINAKDLEMPDLSGYFKIERKYSSINKRSGLLGAGWTFDLDSRLFMDGETVTVLCPDGHTESYDRDGGSWRNTKGGSLAFTLSYDDEKTQWVMADTRQKKKYIYNAAGRLVEITDRNGNSTRIGYQNDMIYKAETSSNHVIRFTCSDGRIIYIEDELGRKLQYKYDDGRLTEVIDTEGGVTRYGYDSQGYISEVTDQNNNTYIKNRYDSTGRVIYQEYANGETCSISYDDEGRQTVFEYSPEKRRQIYQYNEDYLVTRVVYEDGSFEEYGYDQYQNKTSVRDRNGNITSRQYDIYGNILREELPNGLVTEYRYDQTLNPVEQSDNNGGMSRFTYDANGNLVMYGRKVSDDDTWQTTVYEYDRYGRIIRVTDPMGNIRSFSYEDGDKLLRTPHEIKDSEGNIFRYEYDRVGRNTALITDFGRVEYTLDTRGQAIRIRDALGNITRKVYDGVGNLVKLITPAGYDPQQDSGDAYEYRYDPMDELTAVIDPLGNVMKKIHDTRGNIIKEINPVYYDPKTDNGIGIEYVYDHDNRRIKTIYPDGGIERFFYDSNGNLVRHITPEYYDPVSDDGKGMSYAYNSMNQLVQIRNEKGEIIKTFHYDLYGRIIRETAADGSDTLFKYDLVGNLIEKRVMVEKNSERTGYRVTRYEYDLNGNKTKELHGKEAVGENDLPGTWHEISFAYDSINRLIRVSDKSGAQAEYRYNCLNRKIYESIRINSNTTRTIQYNYNELGELSEKIEIIDGKDLAGHDKGASVQSVTRFTYDKNRNITYIHSPNGHVIRREYDKANRLTKEVREDSRNNIRRESVYEYDRAGNLTAVINSTDPLNMTRREFKYDAKNRLTHKIDELGNITRICYDKNDRIIRQILPEGYDSVTDDGIGTCYRYNLAGLVTEVINPLGQTVASNRYDQKGLLIESTDILGNITRFTYNPAGQILDIYTPNSRLQNRAAQRYIYDARGNITGIQDGNGNTTSFLLDDWGRIIQTTAPDGTIEKYTYDYAGNITSTTDGNGNTITYTYNSLNKLSSVTDQLGNTETFFYDMEGNLAEHIDRNGNRVILSFNMDRNLTMRRAYTKDGKESVSESFSYNHDGTLRTAISNGMAYSYSYTPDGKLKSKEASGRTLLRYDYDKNGRLTKLWDISGKETRYVYDAADRLRQVFDESNNKLAEYAYNPDNTVASKLYGNGILTSYAYDGDRNLTELKALTSKGSTLSLMNFSYDLNGNLLKKQEQDHVTHYSYDSLNRLTKAVYDSIHETYSYDRAGNRIEKAIGDIIEKYTYNAKNQLTHIYMDSGTTSFFYDNQGNLTMEAAPEGTNTFSYDALNRQVQAVMKDGNTLVSRYDAEGLRAEIEENEKMTRFIFHKGNILTELDKDYAPIARYTRGNSLVAQTLWNPESKAHETYYHHQDQQGSTIHISDTEENIRNSYRYDAFGMFLENRETIPNRITYAGQQYDSITGQYYLRARYYNPVIGRFTQEDPYRGDGLNLYAYVANNPVSYYDPTGYSKCSVTSSSNNNLPPWGYHGSPPLGWTFSQDTSKNEAKTVSNLPPWGYHGSPPPGWSFSQDAEKNGSSSSHKKDNYTIKTYVAGNIIEEGPYKGWKVTQGFNDTTTGYKGHYGMDLVPNGNSSNIVPLQDGKTVYIRNENKDANGIFVVVEHEIDGETYYSYYMHMKINSIPSELKVGDLVTSETKIGEMGGTGGSQKFAPHLHLQIADKFTKGPYGYISKQKTESFLSPNGYYEAMGMDRGAGLTYYDPMKVFQTQGQLILDSKK